MNANAGDRARQLLRAALWYARAGFPVFPCRERGKEPLTEHGVKDATCDAAIIQAWWRCWPTANIGIAVPSGYVVVDVDGVEGLAAIRSTGDGLPATAWATTARGAHYWYTLPDSVAVRNAVAILPGVDLRAAGGYVIAPPSVHPTGAVYRWQVRPHAFSEAPAWLLALVCPLLTRAPERRSAGAWRDLVGIEVTEGRRNDTVTRLAGHLLRRHVAATVAEALLLAFNRDRCRPPLPDGEVLRVLGSVGTCELKRRERAT